MLVSGGSPQICAHPHACICVQHTHINHYKHVGVHLQFLDMHVLACMCMCVCVHACIWGSPMSPDTPTHLPLPYAPDTPTHLPPSHVPRYPHAPAPSPEPKSVKMQLVLNKLRSFLSGDYGEVGIGTIEKYLVISMEKPLKFLIPPRLHVPDHRI